MIYFARKSCHLLTITILAVLITACGSGRENTITSTTTPAAIYAHSVAFRNNATYSWGANLNGQLGNGDTVADNTQYTPVQVTGAAATGMDGVSAGGTHTLAFVVTGGNAYAWGNNGYGQLGNNSQAMSATPVPVVTDTNGTSLTGVTAVSAGFNHSLAVDGNQHVWAWGDNGEGQLGVDTATTYRTIADDITGLTTVTKIAAGGAHSLAIDGNHNVQAWGSNTSGQLGFNTSSSTFSSTPHTVLKEDNGAFGLALANVAGIAAGGSHSLFLLTNGTVWACGLNHDGQLGDGSTTNRTKGAVQVMRAANIPLDGVIAVAAGQSHSLAIVDDGAGNRTVWAWGYNYYGQLGNPGNPSTFKTTTPVTYPVQVMVPAGTPLTDVTRIVAIGHHSLAVVDDGTNSRTLWAWGDNAFGQLGIADKDTTDRSYAYRVTDLTGYDLYSAGGMIN